MKEILVLGGTGAMGKSLVRILSADHNVVVTSRSAKKSSGNVRYLKGNARELSFLEEILRNHHYDAIVDFMVRSKENLEESLDLLLSSTDQYVFISSARVYSEADGYITEHTPRLLDVSKDEEYLKTNEYALAKAREEDILLKSGRKNFTIIRPSITYNDNRLQLGAFEKEEWLYRVLKGRSLVFSKDMADKVTTMTHGDDVAAGIAAIIGKEDALGEVFHITSPAFLTWKEVLDIYVSALENALGKPIKIVWTERSTMFHFPRQKYRLNYCRLYNRKFDVSKIDGFIDTSRFISPSDGLRQCIISFLNSPQFAEINVDLEALHDRISGEHTSLSEINGSKDKIKYVLLRYHLDGIKRVGAKLLEIIRR